MNYEDDTPGFGSAVLSLSSLAVKNVHNTSTSGEIRAVNGTYCPPTTQFHTHIVTILSCFLNYEAPHFEFTPWC